MSERFQLPRLTPVTGAGIPYAGAKLYFYDTGTSTPKDTYSDNALTTPNANPVVADSDGRFGDIFLAASDYKVVLKTSADVTVWTADPVSGSGAFSAATETVAGVIKISTSAQAAAGTNDATAMSPLKVQQRLDDLAAGFKNKLINGTGFINQRADTTALADDTYGHDRWYRLTQSNAIAVSTLTDVEDTTPRMMRLTQSNVAAQRMGYAQIIEGKNCKHLRGQQVTFRFGRVRLSSSANVRYAVLEWTGGEDTVTSDVVNDWTSGTYTAGNFFLAANLAVSGVTQQVLTANTLADGSIVTATLGSAFNNLIVFAWTEATVAQNVTLDLAKAQLEEGGAATAFEYRAFDDEVYLCRRRVQKTFPLATQPAQALGINTGELQWYMDAANTSNCGRYWQFNPEMAAAPTITLYNPVAATAQIRNFTDAADFTGSGAANVNSNGAMLFGVGNAGNSAADLIAVHALAIVEL